MNIYKPGATRITLAGQSFTADSDGIIDVPNHLVGNAFTQGFVSAKGQMRQSRQTQTPVAAQAQPQLANTTVIADASADKKSTKHGASS